MSAGIITLDWADGEYRFSVARLKEALELEELCGAGLPEILARMLANRWTTRDVRETIRLGLIGGGCAPTQALVLVRRYVEERPWNDSVVPARLILLAALHGDPGIAAKKPAADLAATEPSASSATTDGSSGPPSTA